jgi:hypothetical protein
VTGFHYFLYGLHLHSSIPIDGLEPLAIPAASDCDLRPGDVLFPEDGIALDTTAYMGDEPRMRLHRSRHEPGTYWFAFADETRFRLDGWGRTITTSWHSTREDMSTYLLGPILAFVVRLRGTLALHASALSLHASASSTEGGPALVLAGPPGAGKSTTAAAFVQRGAAMLTDDVAAIDWRSGVPHVWPGYARLRLWADSAAALYGSADALPLLTPTWEKRFADVRSSFASAATPIGAIVMLAGRGPATCARRLLGHEAALATLVRTSLTHLLDAGQRREELDQVARLVESVPVFEVIARDDLAATGELVDAITAALQ